MTVMVPYSLYNYGLLYLKRPSNDIGKYLAPVVLAVQKDQTFLFVVVILQYKSEEHYQDCFDHQGSPPTRV